MDDKRERLLRLSEASQPAVQVAVRTAHIWIWGLVLLFLLTSGFGMGTGGSFRWLAAILVLASVGIASLSRAIVYEETGRLSERTVSMVRSRADRFERSALIDDATGALRRRSFDEAVAVEQSRVHRAPDGPDSAYILLRMAQSPEHETPSGDISPTALAAVIRSLVRFGDLIGRVGDREFGVLLYATPPDQAWEFVERLHAAVAVSGPPAGDREHATQPLEIGVASLRAAPNPEAAQAEAQRTATTSDAIRRVRGIAG